MSHIISESTLGIAAGLLLGIMILFGLSNVTPSNSASAPVGNASPTLSLEDITATLCALGTAQGKEYVILYELYGTPTPDVNLIALSPTWTSTPSDLVGDATRGQELFNGRGACNACHSLTADPLAVGPSLIGIQYIGQYRRPGMSTYQYVRESITYPDIFVVPNYVPGIMPRSYEQTLTQQEIEDLVAFLLTL